MIAGPTAPTTAFPIGAKSDDPVAMYLNDIFTIAANLTGSPALSTRAASTATGCRSGCSSRAPRSPRRSCSTSRIGSSRRPTGIRGPPRSRKERARCPQRGRNEHLGAALRRSRAHARRGTHEWEVVIGLETHAQLSTASKIFSGAATAFGAAPNTQASAVDIALPGVLPVLNRGAVERAIRFGLAVGATIHRRSVFARKNYFYPDLPKGYQISQYELPIVQGGRWRSRRLAARRRA